VSVHSNRNVTRLVTQSGEICIYVPFREVVQALAAVNVLRIHRGIAVNVARVRRIVGRGRHRLFIVLDSGCELTVGRAYQAAIRRQFGASRGASVAAPLTIHRSPPGSP
jgi:DNA-binding LytR/AlgR family response regulator